VANVPERKAEASGGDVRGLFDDLSRMAGTMDAEQKWITIKGTPVPLDENGEPAGKVGEKLGAEAGEARVKNVSPLSREEVRQDTQSAVSRFKDSGLPDGTYSPETGEPVAKTKGFQVSFAQTDDTYTKEQYNALVNRFEKETGADMDVGNFGGTPEASFTSRTMKQAMALAKEFNQHSVFSWKVFNKTGDANRATLPNPYYNPGASNRIEGK
jgi:hypothetical protein